MSNENEDVGPEVVECIGSAWPPSVESYFIGLMEEEVKKGNRKTTTLTKSAWRHIKEEMKSKFGKEYKLDQFKNKYNQLRARWKDFTSLLKMDTGISYNSDTGQIMATDDQWKKLCESYNFAKKFKKKGCLHYDKLCVIFGDTTTSGANWVLSTKIPSISDDDDDDSGGDNSFDQEEDSYQLKKKENVSKDKKKRKAREDAHVAFANAFTTFAETSKKKLEILKKMSTSHVTLSCTNATGKVFGQNNMQDKESLMTCLRVLQGLEAINGPSFAKALKLLKEDPQWRDVFLALSDKRKKDLVLNLNHIL